MTFQPCQCPAAGFCERYGRRMPPRSHAICNGTSGLSEGKRAQYVAQWLNMPPPIPAAKIPNAGPGTELKKLLGWLRIEPGGCQCNGHALTMDLWGSDKCREQIDTIVGWLREEAARREMRFSDFAARQLVRLAIRRAEKAAKKSPPSREER